MDMEKLKALNTPDNLVDSCLIKSEVYAIPPEALNPLLNIRQITEAAQKPILELIEQIPTYSEVSEGWKEIQNQISKSQTEALLTATKALCAVQEQATKMESTLEQAVDKKFTDLIQNLKTRDLMPWKQRFEWMMTGAISLMVFLGLLWLLRLF